MAAKKKVAETPKRVIAYYVINRTVTSIVQDALRVSDGFSLSFQGGASPRLYVARDGVGFAEIPYDSIRYLTEEEYAAEFGPTKLQNGDMEVKR